MSLKEYTRTIGFKMTEKKISKLAISCGGTGGHFYPGLSIAKSLLESGGTPFLMVSGRHALSQAETAEKSGIESIIIKSAPRPKSPTGAISFLVNLLKGILQSRKTLKIFKPDAVLCMGSFASAPPAIAALLSGIPLFLHDGNARIGRANRILSRFAKHLGVAFPPVNADRCKCPYSYTGMPVRQELLAERTLDKNSAINKINEFYGSELNPEQPLLLIFGGSQGAAIFNEIIPLALTRQQNKNFQVIHLSGKGKLENLKKLYADVDFKYLALDSSPHMSWFYAASNLVICRSGGSSIAELTCFGKPALLIPYPYAAEKHQDDNADFLQQAGGALVLQNEACSEEKLYEIIAEWLAEPEVWDQRGKQSASQGKPEAAEQMLKLIEKYI
jgi:UDP-N-acetylglucosamine--N-acetylmuramyl-(pentapeptide) pyrophosphoryl-undecaprenol N-acetylglucosamine transferase